MNLKSLFIITVSLFLSYSCLGPRNFSPITTYDFGKPTQTNIKLNINTIAQNSMFNNKMLFRVSPEKIEINEYVRWTRSPDLILYDYFKGSFIPGGDLFLEGEILLLESDLTTKQVYLTFYYKITRNGYPITDGLFQKSLPSSKNGEEYAKAMAELTRQLITEITQKLASAKQ